jgi:hypothetical protein
LASHRVCRMRAHKTDRANTRTHARSHTHMHARAHTHTHIHTHTHTHIMTHTHHDTHTVTHTYTQAVLGAINSTELWDYYRAHGFPHAFKSGRNQTDPALRGIDRPALQALAKRYSDDFANLGFPVPGGAIV